MYERFFNLRERPFSLTPDPGYLYPSKVHREALSHLRYGIESHAGFVVITGEIGCGKTTLLQTVIRGLDQQAAVARLVNTSLDARELLEAVMLDFGLEPQPNTSKPYLLRDLSRYLVNQRAAGRMALIVVDEAQNLSVPALEEIRMLSNLETEKSKLVQIVLVGQPNLKDLLDQPELTQLRQRVTVNYHLNPLGPDDTHAYINHRLRRAAAGTPLEFPPDVTRLVYLASGGIARKVNVIADAILLFGYGADRRAIDLEITREVLRELGAELPGPAAAAAAPAPPEPPQAPVAASHAAAAGAPPEAALASRADARRDQPEPPQPGAGPSRYGPVWSNARTAPGVDVPPAAARERRQTRFPTTNYRVLAERPPGGPRFWSRVRRSVFGTPKPAFEDQEV